MYFHCACGEMINDTTDALSYKAHLIPDQDLWTFMEAVDRIAETFATSREPDPERRLSHLQHEVGDLWSRFFRRVYQCQWCGRLHLQPLQKSPHFHVFAPEGEGVPTRLRLGEAVLAALPQGE